MNVPSFFATAGPRSGQLELVYIWQQATPEGKAIIFCLLAILGLQAAAALAAPPTVDLTKAVVVTAGASADLVERQAAAIRRPSHRSREVRTRFVAMKDADVDGGVSKASQKAEERG